MAAERIFVPEEPQEITPQWLSNVLGSPVDALKLQDLGNGQGFMGDVLLLTLASNEAAVPNKLVAKLPKKSNRMMGEMLGVYEREIMFFNDLADRLPIRVPRLFYSEFDYDKASEKQGEILRALDNVPLFLVGLINFIGGAIAAAKKRRYMLLIEYFDAMQPGDQLVGLDAASCKQVLSAIVPMHKQFWLDDTLSEHFWLLDLEIDAHMRQGIYRKHVEQYKDKLGDEFHPHLDWLSQHGERLLRQFSSQAPHTLLHCDLRLDNVIFDDDQCAFIDFQMVRHGPAAYDVAYFITSALHADASQQDVDDILRHYHDLLAQPDYGFDRFKRDYERALMVVLGGLSSVDDVELGNERGDSMMAAWMDRLRARTRHVDFESLLDD